MGSLLLALLALPGAALAAGETPSQWQGMVVETGQNFLVWLAQMLLNVFVP